jgi:hypothetical protein
MPQAGLDWYAVCHGENKTIFGWPGWIGMRSAIEKIKQYLVAPFLHFAALSVTLK